MGIIAPTLIGVIIGLIIGFVSNFQAALAVFLIIEFGVLLSVMEEAV